MRGPLFTGGDLEILLVGWSVSVPFRSDARERNGFKSNRRCIPLTSPGSSISPIKNGSPVTRWTLPEELDAPQGHKGRLGKERHYYKVLLSVACVDIICAWPTKRRHVTSATRNSSACKDQPASQSPVLCLTRWSHARSLRPSGQLSSMLLRPCSLIRKRNTVTCSCIGTSGSNVLVTPHNWHNGSTAWSIQRIA